MGLQPDLKSRIRVKKYLFQQLFFVFHLTNPDIRHHEIIILLLSDHQNLEE